jgi:hypothetical protein
MEKQQNKKTKRNVQQREKNKNWGPKSKRENNLY